MLAELGLAGSLIVLLIFIIGLPTSIVYLPLLLKERRENKQKVMKLIGQLIQKNNGMVSEMDVYLAASNESIDINLPLFSSLLREQASYFRAETLISEEGTIYYHFPLDRTPLLLN